MLIYSIKIIMPGVYSSRFQQYMLHQPQKGFQGIYVGIPQHQIGCLICVPSTWKIFYSHAIVFDGKIYCVSIHVTYIFRGTRYATISLIYYVWYIIPWTNWQHYNFCTVWREGFIGKLTEFSRKLINFRLNWWVICRR